MTLCVRLPSFFQGGGGGGGGGGGLKNGLNANKNSNILTLSSLVTNMTPGIIWIQPDHIHERFFERVDFAKKSSKAKKLSSMQKATMQVCHNKLYNKSYKLNSSH